MKRTRLVLVASLGIFLGSALGLSGCEQATPKQDVAKKAATTNDKKIATKEGVAGSLGNKEIEEDQLPGTLEIGFAIGSVMACIAAFKFL
jgi:hypothetical protein